MILPRWMRVALFATAAMNIFGGLVFVPAFHVGRDFLGLPKNAPPLYLWVIAEFVVIMGFGYLAAAVSGRADRLFIAVGATGKLAFCFTFLAFYLSGDLPILAPLAGAGDLIFGILFLLWLNQTRRQ